MYRRNPCQQIEKRTWARASSDTLDIWQWKVLRVRRRIQILFLVAGLLPCFNLVSAQDITATRLENYLESLQLHRLVIQQIEQQIEAELDRDKRLKLAERLMEQYADQLLNSRIDNETSTRWMEKARVLSKIYPTLVNPRLDIAILQARYLVEETQFRDRWKPSTKQPTEDLLKRWQQLDRDLNQFKAETEARYQELVTASQFGDDTLELLGEMTQVEALLLHSNFLTGWSSYFCGVLDETNREHWLRQSDSQFRIFLQIDPRKSLTEFAAKWFDFKSPWQVQALVGLAMTHRGLHHPNQAQHCFDLIQQHGAPDLTAKIPVWTFTSQINIGEFDSAWQTIQSFEQSPGSSLAGKIYFWNEVLSVSFHIAGTSPQISENFKRAALAGLTREGQFETINMMIERYQYELPDDFLGNWVAGCLSFYRTPNIPTVADLAATKTKLTHAIELADASVSKSDLACCQFLLAKIHFRDREFGLAADEFNLVVVNLLENDRPMAAESQWLAAMSQAEISRQDPRNNSVAYAALKSLIRRFPESDYANRAEFEILRLSLAPLPAEESIRRLKRIDVDDPNYHLALPEIARLRFGLWLESFLSGSEDRGTRFKDLVATAESVASNPELDAETKLNITLLVVDALLRHDFLDESLLQTYLDQADLQANALPARSESILEFRYYQMLYAENIHDFKIAGRHARWLVDNAQNSRFESPALIFLARRLDTRHSQTPSKELIDRSIELYKRLVQILAPESQQLNQSSNAQFALTRLAELETQKGNLFVASSYYQRLADSFPDHQQYIYGLAKTKTSLKDFEAARPLWSKLSASTAAGTELWYESKLQLIQCLIETSPESAQPLLRQTLRLNPQMPEQWRYQFSELEKKLESLPRR